MWVFWWLFLGGVDVVMAIVLFVCFCFLFSIIIFTVFCY